MVKNDRRIYIGNIVAIVCITLAGIGFHTLARAEVKNEQPQVKRITIRKELTGEVGGISKSFIAIVYSKDDAVAKEMAFNMDKNVRCIGRKLEEIKVGDIVMVTYEETLEEKEGEEPRRLQRMVREIAFVQPAAVPVQSKVLN